MVTICQATTSFINGDDAQDTQSLDKVRNDIEICIQKTLRYPFTQTPVQINSKEINISGFST